MTLNHPRPNFETFNQSSIEERGRLQDCLGNRLCTNTDVYARKVRKEVKIFAGENIFIADFV